MGFGHKSLDFLNFNENDHIVNLEFPSVDFFESHNALVSPLSNNFKNKRD